MTIRRPPDRYDAMTIFLHWLTVALVAILWIGARTLDWLPVGASRADGRSLHIVVGLMFGALGGARLVWRLSFGRPLPVSDAGWMGAVAKVSHAALYAMLAAMVCVGILLAWTGGDSLFNALPAPALSADAKDLVHQLTALHDDVGWAILALAGLHTLAVLYHHYVLRDAVLGRMLPAARPPPP